MRTTATAAIAASAIAAKMKAAACWRPPKVRSLGGGASTTSSGGATGRPASRWRSKRATSREPEGEIIADDRGRRPAAAIGEYPQAPVRLASAIRSCLAFVRTVPRPRLVRKAMLHAVSPAAARSRSCARSSAVHLRCGFRSPRSRICGRRFGRPVSVASVFAGPPFAGAPPPSLCGSIVVEPTASRVGHMPGGRIRDRMRRRHQVKPIGRPCPPSRPRRGEGAKGVEAAAGATLPGEG